MELCVQRSRFAERRRVYQCSFYDASTITLIIHSSFSVVVLENTYILIVWLYLLRDAGANII